MFGGHVLSLPHDSEVAQGLQHNWDGGEHLSDRLQELYSPHIMSALCAWLATQCDEFVSLIFGNVVVHRVPSPGSPPPPGPHPVHRPAGSEPAHPFSAVAPTVVPVPRVTIVASNPFVGLAFWSVSSTPAPWAETVFGQSIFGHPHLTLFGQSIFGQSIFGHHVLPILANPILTNPTLANPFLAKIGVSVVLQSVRPRRVGGPRRCGVAAEFGQT